MDQYVAGAKKALPIVLGYIPLGFACGVLLHSAGLSTWQIGLMSLIVFGGSAQFMAASLLLNQTEYSAIIPIVLLLNARQMLLTSSLAPYVKQESNLKVALLSHLTADESYALNIIAFRQQETGQRQWTMANALGLSFTAHATWVLGTVLGGILGGFFQFPEVIMNYVLVAMFIGLLVPQIETRLILVVTLLTTLLTLALMNWFQPSIVIVLATFAGSLIGYLLERRYNPPMHKLMNKR